jgi:hypothetical protein
VIFQNNLSQNMVSLSVNDDFCSLPFLLTSSHDSYMLTTLETIAQYT